MAFEDVYWRQEGEAAIQLVEMQTTISLLFRPGPKYAQRIFPARSEAYP